jgi:hypothetical protein
LDIPIEGDIEARQAKKKAIPDISLSPRRPCDSIKKLTTSLLECPLPVLTIALKAVYSHRIFELHLANNPPLSSWKSSIFIRHSISDQKLKGALLLIRHITSSGVRFGSSPPVMSHSGSHGQWCQVRHIACSGVRFGISLRVVSDSVGRRICDATADRSSLARGVDSGRSRGARLMPPRLSGSGRG